MIIHPTAGVRDTRYTVDIEFTGQPAAAYVARFCGEWVGQATTQPDAWQLAQAHDVARRTLYTSSGANPHTDTWLPCRPCSAQAPGLIIAHPAEELH